MKNAKLILAALFVSATVFTACSKDDDKTTAAPLEGKWYLSKVGASVSGVEQLNAYTNECSTKKDYVEFVTGGVFNSVSYDDTCTADTSTGTWTRNGNTITTVSDGETDVETITNLTSSELKISSKDLDTGITEVAVFTKS
jgi:Lipocalin-like domain